MLTCPLLRYDSCFVLDDVLLCLVFLNDVFWWWIELNVCFFCLLVDDVVLMCICLMGLCWLFSFAFELFMCGASELLDFF